ncbi:uncharacterized protein LOC128883771 [Hylaeus volcanicus]|uniref:uncharacterized protein LOC128883771 n=1 Tax=Hylaeus volcanicus TaxID=313075 RepID=UPI0023B81CFE|nr:uncharacterized protein LOC128883771 [Hylaeus volcanicus]
MFYAIFQHAMNKIMFFFLFLLIKSDGEMCGKKQRNVFTVHDTYRETYSATTIPEENFTGWLYNEGPQEPVLSKDSLSKNDSIEYHELWNLEENRSIVIRCPYGWRPVGPFCSTISLVPVYTECPMNFRRFHSTGGNPVFSSSDNPGFCQREDVLGVTLTCPETFVPISPLDTLNTSVLECRQVKVSPVSEILATLNSTTPQSMNNSMVCPVGTFFKKKYGGCVGVKRVPPEPSCPDGYQLTSKVYDPYAFYGKRNLVCTRLVLIKGKLWCPKGYELSGEFQPSLPFGTVITEKHADGKRFVYTKEASMLLKSTWLSATGFSFLVGKPICFQVLFIPASSCNTIECVDPFLKDLRSLLIGWSYHKLLTDPDYIVYMAIPGGKDFKMTSSALRVRH